MSVSPSDAAALANLALRVGIVNDGQIQEGWDELGTPNAPADALVRILERKGYLSPFQSAKLLRGDQGGYCMGGYRLRYKVGSGIFGQIFRADDPSTGQVVALKVLRPEWHEDQHKIDLFLREGRMGMTLRHPNIVEILAVDQDRATGLPYIVMEFVEGGDLRALLAIRKRLAASDMLRILEEAASALAYAFARGVSHRDMKVTNILLSSQGPAKLADFGLAGVQGGKGKSGVKRTQDYAGLEKATRAPAGDPRSDIFFLGCVAYELLTGRRPLERALTSAARQAPERYRNIAPIEPDQVNAPPSVIQLVEAMMALDPAARIQTPAQLLERVRAVRREVEGGSTQPATASRTVFLVESNGRLQDRLRAKLKKAGYRILITADPQRALDRFRSQPFDLLIVNAGTTGDDGCAAFAHVLEEARRRQVRCGGILIVSPDQAAWRDRLADQPGATVLVLPIPYKQLLDAIRTVDAADGG
jgi:CheY-like chemotaxis protein